MSQSEDGSKALQADVGSQPRTVGLPPLPPMPSDPMPVTVSNSGTALQPCINPASPVVTTISGAASSASSQVLQQGEAAVASVSQRLDSRSADANSVPQAASPPDPAAADSNTSSRSKGDLHGATMAKPSPQDLTTSGSDQSSNLSPAIARHAAGSVALSPSLTSLAETAHVVGSLNDSVAAEQSVAGSDAAVDSAAPPTQHQLQQSPKTSSTEGADPANDLTSPTATSGFQKTGFQVQLTDSEAGSGERANTAVISVLEPTGGSRRRANYDTAVRAQPVSEPNAAFDEGQSPLLHSAAAAQQVASSECRSLSSPSSDTLSHQLSTPHCGPDPQTSLAELSAVIEKVHVDK